MTVVVFSPYYPPAFLAGGPVKSISRLVRAARPPFAVQVVSRNWDLGQRKRLRTDANAWVARADEVIWPVDRGVLRYARALLAAGRQRPRVVYVNSLFDPWFALVPALLWWLVGSRRSDLVIAPRGQLASGPLAKSASRKLALIWVWRRLARHNRAVLHAATDQEKVDIERVLGRVSVVVRSNDVGPLLPALDAPAPVEELRAVFLGRIVPIKGLLDLLTSLRRTNALMALDVYGPEEDKRYAQQCRHEASQLPESVRVRFLGPVASDDVRALLAGYDVMLNPTRGESFGQAIGESLSVGTPVAVPPVTPWTPWISGSDGGVIVLGDDWAAAVGALWTMDPVRRCRLRDGARHAYETWWSHAQGQPHVFETVVSRESGSGPAQSR